MASQMRVAAVPVFVVTPRLHRAGAGEAPRAAGAADSTVPATPPLRIPQSLLLSREEAEAFTPYQVINPGIAGGFINPHLFTLPRVWVSVHNQTLNLYTHLVACLLYAALVFSYWPHMTDALRAYCIAAGLCWALSAFWHATSFISEAWMRTGLALDYAGVVVLGAASNVLVASAELASPWVVAACIAVGATFAARVARVHFAGDIRKAKFGPMNAAHSLGILAFWAFGQRRGPWQLAAILASYALYGVGLAVHQTRWPEKWHPQYTVLYSHPIMHVLVAMGSAVLALGYWELAHRPV